MDQVSDSMRDRWVGLALFVFAAAWTGIAYTTIPAGDGEVGPRAFPMLLGLALAGMALVVFFGSFRAAPVAHGEGEDASMEETLQRSSAVDRNEAITVAYVVVLTIGYGFLLEKMGFLIATPILIVAALWGMLGVRKPTQVLVFALGMTIGCWLVFGKLLGAYLPPGAWTGI